MGCTYKITHMSAASYPTLLSLFSNSSLEHFFYLSVFFFLFNIFLYIHAYANEISCILIIRSNELIALNFFSVPRLVVQDI